MQEYRPLHDEFNRGHKETLIPEDGKKKIRWVTSIALIFLMSVTLIMPFAKSIPEPDTGDYTEPDPISEPLFEPDPVEQEPEPYEKEEYDIIGLWKSGDIYFNFLEDGTGYYLRNGLFVLLNWKEEDGDYRITGKGMTEVRESIVLWETDQMSSYRDGKLMLTDDDFDELAFVRSDDVLNDENVIDLIGVPLEERIEGFWEYSELVMGGNEIDLMCSYIILKDGTMTTDIGNDKATYEHFEAPYAADVFPDIVVSGPFTFYYKSGNNSWQWNAEQFSIYFFITEDGDMMLADTFSAGNTILYKEDFEF